MSNMEPFTDVQTGVLEFMLKERLAKLQAMFPSLTEKEVIDIIHCSLFNPSVEENAIRMCEYKVRNDNE